MDGELERSLFARLLGLLDVEPRVESAFPDQHDAVLRVARYHRISPLLSRAEIPSLSPELREAFKRDRVVAAARNMMFARVGEECIRAFAESGIRTVVLKGLAYEAMLYAKFGPGSRPTGDIDLLVPGDQRRLAFNILDRLGFEPRAAAPGFDESDYHEVAWTRGGVEVDLHFALAPLARCRIDYPDLWSRVRDLSIGQTPAFALAAPHAVVFHALHMAIDHYTVPGLHLVDLCRMLATAEDVHAAEEVATRWRCRRPMRTALSITAALLPGWARSIDLSVSPPRPATRILVRYGSTAPVSRLEQLRRKLEHFDFPADAMRYTLTQARRKARETVERRLRRRSARERLNLGEK